MLSMMAFLLFPLVALGVRLHHGRTSLLLAMLLAGSIADTDTRWHWLTPRGDAGFYPLGMWAVAVVTAVAYLWLPKHVGLRIAQFVGTIIAALFASGLGGFWVA